MCANSHTAQRTIVHRITVVSALRYRALDALVCFHAHFDDLLRLMSPLVCAGRSVTILGKKRKHAEISACFHDFKVLWRFALLFSAQPLLPC